MSWRVTEQLRFYTLFVIKRLERQIVLHASPWPKVRISASTNELCDRLSQASALMTLALQIQTLALAIRSSRRLSRVVPPIPMFIHATVPPGVETMKRLRGKITYQAENTAHGAQLRITTHDAQALAAIHSFLRFQIQDHQTGDSLEEQK